MGIGILNITIISVHAQRFLHPKEPTKIKIRTISFIFLYTFSFICIITLPTTLIKPRRPKRLVRKHRTYDGGFTGAQTLSSGTRASVMDQDPALFEEEGVRGRSADMNLRGNVSLFGTRFIPLSLSFPSSIKILRPPSHKNCPAVSELHHTTY